MKQNVIKARKISLFCDLFPMYHQTEPFSCYDSRFRFYRTVESATRSIYIHLAHDVLRNSVCDMVYRTNGYPLPK